MSAISTRSDPATVSLTLAFASAVPEITTEERSTALMRSSPATVEIWGALGTSVSTLIARVTGSEVLPAKSTARADRVSSPCPIAVMSAAVSV